AVATRSAARTNRARTGRRARPRWVPPGTTTTESGTMAAGLGRSAVVVGAGIGGLAAAGALARTGWRVTLLEREDRLRAEPTALLLRPSGVRALNALGLGAGLDAISTTVPDHGLRRPDGSWLVQPGRSGTARPGLAHAEGLHDAQVAGPGGRGQVHTGPTRRPAARLR